MIKLLNYKFTLIVLALIAAWMVLSALDVRQRQLELSLRQKEMQAKTDAVERENEMLDGSSEYFKSQAFLEKQARLKYNYKLPDERVVMFYDGIVSRRQESPESVKSEKQNYDKWFDYLLGR